LGLKNRVVSWEIEAESPVALYFKKLPPPDSILYNKEREVLPNSC